MILLLVLFIILLVVSVSWIRLVRESRRINVKGPFPLPILGNAHLFIAKTSEFLNLLQKFSLKYGNGNHFRAYFFSTPYVILSHPKYIEPLITSTEFITKGRSYSFLLPWLGQGLLTSTGQKWKTHRKLLTPALHFNILQNFLPVFCKNQNTLTEKLRDLADGRPVDLFPIVALTALDNVTESIMGISMNLQKQSKSNNYVKYINDLSVIVSMRMQIPFLGEDAIFNLLPLKKKQDEAIKYLHEITNTVIETRREELRKINKTSLDGNSDIGIKNKHAFLDLLLLADVDGKKIDQESIREEVNTFMFAGHDTVSTAIVCSLFCLSKHRDVQEKILEEQKQIFGDDIYRDPTHSDLQQMKYLETVIKESMRLYPSAPLIERRITRDCEIGELKLVKGTSAMINIFQAQRHPDVYDHPLEFRPERFEGPLKNPFDWLAFSAGPRNCIGQKFAMMELKVSLSAMIKNFVMLPADIEPEFGAELVLRSKNGVHVKLLPRK